MDALHYPPVSGISNPSVRQSVSPPRTAGCSAGEGSHGGFDPTFRRALQVAQPHVGQNMSFSEYGLAVAIWPIRAAARIGGNLATAGVGASAGQFDDLALDGPAGIDRVSGEQFAGHAQVVGGVPVDSRTVGGKRAGAPRRAPRGVDRAGSARSLRDPPEAWSQAVPRPPAGPPHRCGPGTSGRAPDRWASLASSWDYSLCSWSRPPLHLAPLPHWGTDAPAHVGTAPVHAQCFDSGREERYRYGATDTRRAPQYRLTDALAHNAFVGIAADDPPAVICRRRRWASFSFSALCRMRSGLTQALRVAQAPSHRP